MSKPLKFKSGDHWTTCQRCGKVVRSSNLREEWTGLWVCPDDWEPRHPQDFVRARQDSISVYPSLPEQVDTFIGGKCSTRSATAGEAIAGCAIIGFAESDDNEIPSGSFNTNTL